MVYVEGAILKIDGYSIFRVMSCLLCGHTPLGVFLAAEYLAVFGQERLTNQRISAEATLEAIVSSVPNLVTMM